MEQSPDTVSNLKEKCSVRKDYNAICFIGALSPPIPARSKFIYDANVLFPGG